MMNASLQSQSCHPSVTHFAANGINDRDAFLKKVAMLSQSAECARADINTVTFEFAAKNMTSITRALRHYGVVCLTNVVSEQSINDFNGKFDALMSRLSDDAANPDTEHGCIDGVSWQRNLKLANNFNELVEFGAPIVNIRGSESSDTGMRDVFNVQKIKDFASDSLITECEAQFSSGLVQQIVRQVSPFLYTNTQVYENQSITDTRGFHIDNIFGTHKAFLYLTDVLSEGDGPYCYAPGTHKLPYLHRLELRYTERMGIRSRDMLSGDYLHAIKMIAPKGTLIISNQTGIHRGIPQRKGAFRRVLVGNFSEHNKVARNY
ncbi:hypothetical protein [Alteromonas sp. H39]|uniref:hypothetical protein n=1 Tax=Alteromonas sp. H39 TaxID=3389876 RepID=UPI0039DFA722